MNDADTSTGAQLVSTARQNLKRDTPFMVLKRDEDGDRMAGWWLAYWRTHCGEREGRDFIVKITDKQTRIYRATYQG